MKANFKTIALIGLFAAASTGAVAHEDFSEAGSFHWLGHVAQRASTPEMVRQERESQRNWDRDAGNHVEGVGGHALHEAKKMPPATKEQMAQKRENEKTLDRGKDNHEEGVGGHGLYEALKK